MYSTLFILLIGLTQQQITDAIDTRLAPVWAAIQTREAAYILNHGVYWQGLRTHIVDPADGVDAAPDNLAVKPDYQATGWADLGGFPASFPATFILDQYEGPGGVGYVATVRLTINGRTWQRSRQFGPETYRNAPWTDVTGNR